MNIKRNGGSLSLSENEMDSEDDDLDMREPLQLPTSANKLSSQSLQSAASVASASLKNRTHSGSSGGGDSISRRASSGSTSYKH